MDPKVPANDMHRLEALGGAAGELVAVPPEVRRHRYQAVYSPRIQPHDMLPFCWRTIRRPGRSATRPGACPEVDLRSEMFDDTRVVGGPRW